MAGEAGGGDFLPCSACALNPIHIFLWTQVVSGWAAPNGQGQPSDFFKVLAPQRALRPMNGGLGFTEEAVTFIRALNFDLD